MEALRWMWGKLFSGDASSKSHVNLFVTWELVKKKEKKKLVNLSFLNFFCENKLNLKNLENFILRLWKKSFSLGNIFIPSVSFSIFCDLTIDEKEKKSFAG